MQMIIYNINKIYSMHHDNVPVLKDELSITPIINNSYIVIKYGIIIKIAQGDYRSDIDNDTELFDANNMILLPGLIDAHTHLVFGGSRENEYELKLQGVAYLDILKSGGGILSTVKATRSETFSNLYNSTYKIVDNILKHGVTTLEAKSGYGLNFETELKQLEVAHEVANNHPCEIVHTFMPAHAIPTEFKANPSAYVEKVKIMIEQIKDKNLVKYVDIFCEDGVFDKEQSYEILTHAKKHGFKVKIHADEVVPMGGAALAAELNAISAEHLMATELEEIRLLAKAKVIANLLPATTFNLSKEYAKARTMINEGVAVTICSDFNPGSCPNENLQLTLQIGSRGYKMTPVEVYQAATINAACALEIEEKVGSIAVGKQADLILMDAPNLEYTIYHFGINHVHTVFKKGKVVVYNQNIL